MSGESKAVFLSYASEDSEAAQRIAHALKSASIEVWFDQSELRGGDAWDQTIRKQIKACALFIPVISRHTHERREGYFRFEWKLALDRSNLISATQVFLIPVVIDDTREDDEEVPEKIRDIHWTRLPTGETPPAFVERIRRLLSAEHSPARAGAVSAVSGPTLTQTPSKSVPSRSPKWTLWALGALLVAGLAYFAFQGFLHSKRHGSAPSAAKETIAGVAISEKSIAVLPFVDLSEKHDQEYFADGMAEEVLDVLAKIPELRVIGRTSSFQFKGRSEDLRAIGEKLGAAYVVEGSVRTVAPHVRVTAQLIDTRSGTRMWTESYDRDLGDVLGLQEQVATSIARALQLAVVNDEPKPQRQLPDPEAYTLYLRGRAALDRGSGGEEREAIADFEQVIALDPLFARAYEALALAHFLQISDARVTSGAGWPSAVNAARRTLQLDPTSGLARILLAMYAATSQYDWRAASAGLDAELATHPRDPLALYLSAWLAFDLGRHDEARRLQDASLAIDPLNPESYNNSGWIDYLTGDLDGAERAFRRSLEVSPTYSNDHLMLGKVLLLRGAPASALKEVEAEPDPLDRDGGLALAYYALGRQKESDAAVARVTRTAGDVAPVVVAEVHAYRGERDQAFAWLAKSVAARELNLVHEIRDEPLLASLRSDTRYAALLRQMNLSP